MSETNLERSLMKGLIAGAVAGLVATAAKSIAERIYPPRAHDEPAPTETLAEKLAGHELAPASKELASRSLHWGFGAAAGAVYGALVEYYPAAAAKEGASFGLALMALTHEGALPALGVEPPAEEQTTREHTSEAASHVLYGVVAERVRSLVRVAIG